MDQYWKIIWTSGYTAAIECKQNKNEMRRSTFSLMTLWIRNKADWLNWYMATDVCKDSQFLNAMNRILSLPQRNANWKESFFKKWANPGLFSLLFSSFSHYNLNKTNRKKRRWCAWDLNPGLHDGRHRWNHGDMAVEKNLLAFVSF